MIVQLRREPHGCVGLRSVISIARDVSSIASAMGCSLYAKAERPFETSCITGNRIDQASANVLAFRLPCFAGLCPMQSKPNTVAMLSPQMYR